MRKTETSAPHTARGRALECMRSQSMRLTLQRRLVVEMTFATRDHFTAESLLAQCRRRNGKVSRATVYRTLAFLVKAGLLRQVGLGQQSPQYDPNFADAPRHGHFVCVDCQKVVEFHDPCLDVRESIVTKEHGFSPKRVSLQIEASCDAFREKGVCPRRAG
ncbi:MAG: transcriptional repressor [Verrucomicrobia bacterium]|nr:transcriptional repressor [Verrucomicrobiota bacterium]NBR62964.1 transcriptional repressor [Verrucomicrobiota bacterium]